MTLTPVDLLRMVRAGDVVTTQQAAERLGVTERAVRKWVDRGHIQPLGRTKPYLFVYDQLADYAATTNSPRNRRVRRARTVWESGTVPSR